MDTIDLTKLTEHEAQIASEAIAEHRRIRASRAKAVANTSTILDVAKAFKDYLLLPHNVGCVKINEETFLTFLKDQAPLSSELTPAELWSGANAAIKDASFRFGGWFTRHVESPSNNWDSDYT